MKRKMKIEMQIKKTIDREGMDGPKIKLHEWTERRCCGEVLMEEEAHVDELVLHTTLNQPKYWVLAGITILKQM